MNPLKRKQGGNNYRQPSVHTISIPVSSLVQKSQQVQSDNRQLAQCLEGQLKGDWEDLKFHDQRLEFINRHILTLQRVKQQLAQSLQTIQNTLSRPLNIAEGQENKSFESDYETLNDMVKGSQNMDHSLKQKILAYLGQYQCKFIVLSSELQATKGTVELQKQQIKVLQAKVEQTDQNTKTLYNELLEVTSQLKNLEQSQHHSDMSRIAKEVRSENLSTHRETREVSPRDYLSQASNNDAYPELKKCYEEIASLKEQLREALTSQKDNFRTLESQKARTQLDQLLLKKQLEQSQNEVKHLKARLQIQRMENPQFLQKGFEPYEEEIYYLKTKVLTLQSMQLAHHCHKIQEPDLSIFFEQIQPLLRGSERMRSCLQYMVRTFSVLKKIELKVVEQQRQIDHYKRKTISYKAKYQSVLRVKEKGQKQMRRGFKAKYEDYNRLIEKMQGELQKVNQVDKQETIHEMLLLLTAPLHQELQIAHTQIVVLRKQLALRHPSGQKQGGHTGQLVQQMQTLQQENINLMRVNRQVQKKMLEQTLNTTVSKVKENNQFIMESRKVVSMETGPQIAALEEQITVLTSRLQQTTDLLSKQTVHGQQLEKINTAQGKQIQELMTHISQIMQKNRRTEVIVEIQNKKVNSGTGGQSGSKVEWNWQQNVINKQWNSQNEILMRRVEKAEADSVIYKRRVEEVQEVLRMLNKQKEDKDAALQRLASDKEVLENELEQFGQELQLLRGKASSLKRIEWIQQNRGLETQLQTLKRQNTQTAELLRTYQHQIDILRKQCDSFTEDNVKLMLLIKQNNIDSTQLTPLIDKYQLEQHHKVIQLQQKITGLNQDNQILKNLVDDLRQHTISQSPGVNGSVAELDLKAALLQSRNQVQMYRAESQDLREELVQYKQQFQGEWERLVGQLNKISEELQFYKKGGPPIRQNSISDKDVVESERSFLVGEEWRGQGKIVKSEIIDLMGELEIKNSVIRQLREDLRKIEEKLKTSEKLTQNIGTGTEGKTEEKNNSDEILHLRQQNQKLRKNNFNLNQRVRNLEQDYNALKFKILSHSPAPRPNFNSAPYLEHGQMALPPRLNTLSSQSEVNSAANLDEVGGREEGSGRGMGSMPMVSRGQKSLSDLADLAPLVESVRQES